MDLQEATVAMAALMRGEMDFYKEHLEGARVGDLQESKRYKTALREYEWLQSNTREFGNTLAANPSFFGIMESWKVVIKGTAGVGKESIENALETDDIEDLISRCGSLPVNIIEHIKSKGLLLCDMSAGEDGWDISVRCTEKNSKLLCFDMHKKYFKTIELKLIVISRRFSGHCLPGLYTWDDAVNFLKVCGI